jgi:His-Xaa-Ser system protein HxsD
MPAKREPIRVGPKGKEATVIVNTKLYPPEVIYSAAYVFIDRAHFLFGGDPKKEVVVTIKSKEKGLDLKRLCLDFNNELINYSVYVIQAARKQAIREAIIKRALATNTEPEETEMDENESDEGETDESSAAENETDEDEGWLDDPDGIAEPWTPDKAKGIKKPR